MPHIRQKLQGQAFAKIANVTGVCTENRLTHFVVKMIIAVCCLRAIASHSSCFKANTDMI